MTQSKRHHRGLIGLVLLLVLSATSAHSQPQNAPSWYQTGAQFVKISVVEDGVYRLSGSMLAQAGVPLPQVETSTLRLLENGNEIPIYVDTEGPLQSATSIWFAGRRNTGHDETWAYDENLTRISSQDRSLYTDTTHYWLTWGGEPGIRYRAADNSIAPGAQIVTSLRETVRHERDLVYYMGDIGDTGNPRYTRGEGWYMREFNQRPIRRDSVEYTIPLGRIEPSADDVSISIQLNGGSGAPHRITARLVDSQSITPFTLGTVNWSGYSFANLSANVPQASLANISPSSTTIRVVADNSMGDGNAPNITYLDWIDISLRRQLWAENGQRRFRPATSGAFEFRITNLPASQEVLALIPERAEIIRGSTSSATYSLGLVATGSETVWLSARDTGRTPVSVRMGGGTNLAASSHRADYVIIARSATMASAEEMATFHRDENGLEVIIVNLQDVFDQFDYGRVTPVAIRRFLRATRSWTQAPQHILLWGDARYQNARQPLEVWEVPSFGHASSDGWFAMQVSGLNDWSEFLNIGRIPVRTNEDGRLFATKMRRYHSAPLDDWQQRAIMMTGGEPQEQGIFQFYTRNWGRRISEPPTTAAGSAAGMEPRYFFKTSDIVLDASMRDSIRVAIREGASWMTYFGHSSAQTWEIVTDAPQAFDNAHRLPIVCTFGCSTGAFAGGIFEDEEIPSLAESLVLGSENGAIAHFGSSQLGRVNESRALGDYLHEVVFRDSVRVLGTALRLAKRRMANITTTQTWAIRHLLQYNLIGDPYTRIQAPTQPDLALSPQDISVTPSTPIPADSLLVVSVNLRNRGAWPRDPFTLSLLHTAPGGTQKLYEQTVEPFSVRTNRTFSIPIDDSSPGEHRFRLEADPEGLVPDLDRSNNVAQSTHFVFANGVVAISPLPFSSTDSTPTLRVGLAALGIDEATASAYFELDTQPSFDSPALRSHSAPIVDGHSDWSVSGSLPEGVYYWRARLDVESRSMANWTTGVFTVTAQAPLTWLQAGDLWSQNDERNVRLNRTNGAWTFAPYPVNVFASSERGNGTFKGQFLINSHEYLRLRFGWGFLVMDGDRGTIRFADDAVPYANELGFDEAAQLEKLRNLVAGIDHGDYFFLRTRHLGRSTDIISDEVRSILRSLGSTAIDTLTLADLWLARGRMGYPEQFEERVEPAGQDFANEITWEADFQFSFPDGETVSPLIGPARSWYEANATVELLNQQSASIEVLSQTGEVLASATGSEPTIHLESVDARAHPYLRLRGRLQDSSQLSTPQLESWSVAFDPVPDLALTSATFSQSSISEGEPLVLATTVRNLGPVSADSIDISLTLVDESNRSTRIEIARLSRLPVDSSATFQTTVATRGLRGIYQAQVSATQLGVHEAITYNNVRSSVITIRRDTRGPLMQVTIDGEVIPNNPNRVTNTRDPAFPYVSARPSFEFFMADDNRFVPLEDISAFEITLNGVAVPHDQLRLEESPEGPDSANVVRVLYQPDLSRSDTLYTLVARAQDASGNPAVVDPSAQDPHVYQVHFRVQQSLEVESLYPYPNPMSRNTRLMFRMRGAETAQVEDFRIRIYTINGRLIREFDLLNDPTTLDGGMLRIGWNAVPWDGRDQDGGNVASGVYLYRVFLRADGQDHTVNEDRSVGRIAVIR